MKKRRGVILLSLLAVSLAAGAQTVSNTNTGTGNDVTTGSPSLGPAPSISVIDVETFAKKPDKYSGQSVTLRGVVQKIIPGRSLYALIPVSEFQQCGLQDCSSVVLPVSYSEKPPPSAGTTVLVTGRLDRDLQNKRIFKQENVKVAATGAPAR